MSEAEIDSILRKYDRTFMKPSRNEIPMTQRKRQQNPHTITFMDTANTPLKQAPNTTSDLLSKLDYCEQQLAISQRNYAQAIRKYDKLKLAYNNQSQELEIQRKGRLQELIDLQNKFRLLQEDSDANVTKLQARENMVAILREKLRQKEEEVVLYEQELQNVSKKVFQTLEMNREMREKSSYGEISSQEASRILDGMKSKYEKMIQTLKSELGKFEKDLLNKQKEKKKILQEMQAQQKKHQQQLHSLKKILQMNQQQYKSWLSTSTQEKQKLIQDYEYKVQQLQKAQIQQKIQKSEKSSEEMQKSKSLLRELQVQNTDLQAQNKKLCIEIEELVTKERENGLKVKNIGEELKRIQGEFAFQVEDNHKMLTNLKNEEQRYEKLRTKFNQTQIQLESAQLKILQLEDKNASLTAEVKGLRQSMSAELQSLLSIKKQLSEATNNELNINSTLTQTSLKLEKKIQNMKEELEILTTELYAERLEKAKLKDQLYETKTQLKREYELSVDNLKRELEDQIRNIKESRVDETTRKQKEEIYLNMFKMERDYQLLRSEVVTVDQVLRMGSKMAKFYCNQQSQSGKKKVR